MLITRTKGGDPHRLAQVRQVDALRAIGITATRACSDVGIPLATYNTIKAREAGKSYRTKKKAASPAKENGPTIEVPEGTPTSLDDSNGPNAARPCGKAA